MNIIIPMAGEGSRFKTAGYESAKPFIQVGAVTMLELVTDNLSIPDVKFTLLVKEEHLVRYSEVFQRINGRIDLQTVSIPVKTEGTAMTLLYARHDIDPSESIIIANVDQFILGGIGSFVEDARARDLDGSLMCFRCEERDPKWSYALVNPDGLVQEVKEKEAISDLATVGVYYFKRAADFFDCAVQMIIENDRVNGEFYTCPVYNYVARRAPRIGVFEIPRESMWGLGTPEDLAHFLIKMEKRV